MHDYLYLPCVQCGACCKKIPCGFGHWNKDKTACIYLQTKEEFPEYSTHQCGIYEFILTQPGHDFMPAFGAGCCRSLFNDDRDRILRHQKETT